MGVLISFYIIPLGRGTSISRYVGEATRILRENNVKYMLTPESTIIEADSVEEGLKNIATVHEKIMSLGVERMVTVVKIDDRRDKPLSIDVMRQKIKLIEEGVG